MNLTDQQLMDFDRHLNQLAAEYGLELTVQDKNALLQQSLNGGFNGSATVAAFEEFAEQYADDFDDEEDFEEQEPEPQQGPRRDFQADLAHDLAHLQRDLGRKLTGKEIDGVSQRAIDQVGRHDNFDVHSAFDDFHRNAGTTPDKSEWTSKDWNDFCVERARDMDPEPGPDPDREYDLSNRDDFVEYAALKIQGTEFEGAPARPEPEGENG